MTTIREDRLDQAVRIALSRIQLSPKAIVQLRNEWKSGSMLEELTMQRQSLLAKIEDRQSKVGRLADLLIDHSLDRRTYDTKKQELGFELSQLHGQLDDLPDPNDIKHEREDYVRTMSQLGMAYAMAQPAEKRELLRNTFSSCTADQQQVQLAERSWIGIHCSTIQVQEGQKLPI